MVLSACDVTSLRQSKSYEKLWRQGQEIFISSSLIVAYCKFTSMILVSTLEQFQ